MIMEDTIQQNISPLNTDLNTENDNEERPNSHKIIITVFIIVAVFIILFLIYENGKSVYYQGV